MQPLSVELGPGILGNIFDGIQVNKCNGHSFSEVDLGACILMIWSYYPVAAPSKNHCN
jgi:hypothetical protein